MTGKLKWYRKTEYQGVPSTLRNSLNYKFFAKIIDLAKNEKKSKDELSLLYRNINRLAVLAKKDSTAMECLFYVFLPFIKNVSTEVYNKYYRRTKLSAVYNYLDVFQTAIEYFIYYTVKYYDAKLSSFAFYITNNLKHQLADRAQTAAKKEKYKETFEAVSDSQAKDHNYSDGDALHKQVMSKILIEDLYSFLGSIPVRSLTTTAKDLRDEFFFGKSTLQQMSARHKISKEAIYDMLERFKLLIIDKVNNDGNWDCSISNLRTKKNAQTFNITME